MPPLVRGISFNDAIARFKMIGWRDDRQSGSHHFLRHPKRPGVRLNIPDHRRRDMDAMTLGKNLASAGITLSQFMSLSGKGRRRNARRIRQEVYGMAD